MSQILVVTPVPADRRLMSSLLERLPACNVVEADTADHALTLARLVPLDLLLVDVCTPATDALGLIHSLAAEQPLLPIVVVVEAGAEEQAREALQTSAAGFVAHSRLANDLVEIVSRVLSVANRACGQMRVHCIGAGQTTAFELDNDPSCVGAIVQHVSSQCRRFGVTNEQEQLRVAVALEEALLNAIIHGNLQVTSELRERSDDAFRNLVERRRRDPEYASRRVRLNCDVDADRARIVIRDEGPGFDVRRLPDPRDPCYLTRASGRGVLLMRTFMDEVVYNDAGNEVTLVKRRRDDQRRATSRQESCSL
jgi:anti-sigma regulatory factor (Ser/Thr protein kinase)